MGDEIIHNWAHGEHFSQADTLSLHKFGYTTLQRLLMQEDCTPEAVKRCIQSGGNVNLGGRNEIPILTAVSRRLDKAIIQEILNAGINFNKIKHLQVPVLCAALQNRNSVEVVEMLIEKGFPMEGCTLHPTTLHCAVGAYPATDSDLAMLHMLLKRSKKNELNVVNRYGQSLVCLVLSRCHVNFLKALLDVGCSINSCQRHKSVWECATSYTFNLKMDVLEHISRYCSYSEETNDLGENPLHMALKYCPYNLDAIQFLISLQTKELHTLRNDEGDTLLHAAVANRQADPKAVALLIKNKAHVNAVNKCYETPLHFAVVSEEYQYEIIKTLLDNDADVNALTSYSQTPLNMGVLRRLDCRTLQLMVSAGCRVRKEPAWTAASLTWALVENTQPEHEDNQQYCHIFIKYAVLSNPNVITEIQRSNQENWSHIDFESYIDECSRELRLMIRKQIAQDMSLYQLIRDFFRKQDLRLPGFWDVKVDLSDSGIRNILLYLDENQMFTYLDLVFEAIGRQRMNLLLHSVVIYTVVPPSLKHPKEKDLYLNYEAVACIAQFLSDKDFVRLIVCFSNVM